MYICTCMYIYVCVYIYICICICIFIFICTYAGAKSKHQGVSHNIFRRALKIVAPKTHKCMACLIVSVPCYDAPHNLGLWLLVCFGEARACPGHARIFHRSWVGFLQGVLKARPKARQ